MNRKMFKTVGILGLAIAAFAAPSFTTKANVKQTDTFWKQTGPGQWTQINENDTVLCDGTPNICVMRFPEGKTPSDGLGFGTVVSSEGYALP